MDIYFCRKKSSDNIKMVVQNQENARNYFGAALFAVVVGTLGYFVGYCDGKIEERNEIRRCISNEITNQKSFLGRKIYDAENFGDNEGNLKGLKVGLRALERIDEKLPRR